MSLHEEMIVKAYGMGYRVDKYGQVISPFSGKPRKLRKHLCAGVPYYDFTIKHNRQANVIKVHKLVAYQKFGKDAFKDGIVTRHLDGNSENNCPSNIDLGTQSQNQMDRDPEDRLSHSIKAATSKRVLTDHEVMQVRLRRSQGLTYQQLADEFGLSGKGQAHYIVNNDYKTKV